MSLRAGFTTSIKKPPAGGFLIVVARSVSAGFAATGAGFVDPDRGQPGEGGLQRVKGGEGIRVERRGEAQLQIGYVISGYFAVLADFRLLQSLRLAHKQQIVWVLYGQASRAISIG